MKKAKLEQSIMILNSLPSLYSMQDFEEEAIEVVVARITELEDKMETGDLVDPSTAKEIQDNAREIHKRIDDAGADILDRLAELAEMKKNPLLNLEQLRERDKPVWVRIDELPFGGYWCLCAKGLIIAPSGNCFNVEEIPKWKFYDHEYKEDK